MSGRHLGDELIQAGWRQGVLLPPLSWGVIFDPERPLTGAARAATRGGAAQVSGASPPHHAAFSAFKADDRLIVVSQTCDIARSETVEPTVLAMRAFTTGNQRILSPAATNSTRHFLLDPRRGLVIDATVITLVEKPVLARFTPEMGVPDAFMEGRLAAWLAGRFSRYAFPDEVVGAVVKPLLENLRRLQEAGNPLLRVLDPVQEIRLGRLDHEAPPYAVRLLFIVPQEGLADRGVGLAELVGQMQHWFEPAAHLEAWDALDLYRISVGDYLATDALPLDSYTYRGQMIAGLGPPPRV